VYTHSIPKGLGWRRCASIFFIYFFYIHFIISNNKYIKNIMGIKVNVKKFSRSSKAIEQPIEAQPEPTETNNEKMKNNKKKILN